MTDAFFKLLVLVLCITSWLMLWFRSSMPVSVTKTLRLLGYRKHHVDFWPDEIEYRFWIRSQWQNWLGMHMGGELTWIESKAFYLAQCPFCMALHLSWIHGLVAGYFWGWPWFVIFPAYVWASLTLHQKTSPKKNET